LIDMSKLSPDDGAHELQNPSIVMRDSLGYLAIQILSKQHDIGTMDYDEMLRELHQIIIDLHDSYHSQHFG